MRLGERPGGQRVGGGGGGQDGFEIISGVRASLITIMAGFTFMAVIILALSGFGSVEISEYGLLENLVTRKVAKAPFGAGRYWIGPWCRFIRFPSVVKTIQFSDSSLQTDLGFDELGDPMLRSRTSDGLDVSIELSFQYQLHEPTLYTLYTTLGPGLDFHRTYVRIAIDRLTEIATEYSAGEFFYARTKIGKDMEVKLKKDFEASLYATIFSFQLRSVALPAAFENSIQGTEVQKQEVHVAEAEQQSTKVSLETKLMQAKRRVKVRKNAGDAYAQSVMLANTADIEQFVTMQEKAADSYSGILKQLDGKENNLLAYVQSRVIRDHNGDHMTVGLTVPTISAA